MKQLPLAEVKDHLTKCLRDAERSPIVITRHGKPAGVLMGFASEDEWFEYRLENDPAFLKRIERARLAIKRGKGVAWEQVKKELAER
jgi:prevent-host-death family protein